MTPGAPSSNAACAPSLRRAANAVCVPIDVEGYVAWCAKQDHPLDSGGRAGYAAELLRRQHQTTLQRAAPNADVIAAEGSLGSNEHRKAQGGG
jgi:hypothetical protein